MKAVARRLIALIVDDDPEDVLLIHEALEATDIPAWSTHSWMSADLPREP
jgi:hypothetical protein